ncbi:MAG: adenosylcobinamide-GDP ribazoletransferase [Bacillota bacterium]
MKNIFSSLAIAFAMYSKIPMPRVNWDKSRMKYVMIFFPLVGVVVGGCVFGMILVADIFGMSQLLLACISTVVPIIITGGIHFDGYMDTVDAISSYAEKERKLEILKDPHVGAFGVIYAIVYVVIFVGGMFALLDSKQGIVAVSLAFVLSRCLSAISACNFKSANCGSLSTFKDASEKSICNACLFSFFAVLVGLFGFFSSWFGVVVVAVQLLWLGVYRIRIYKIFGGVTGDTAGYFLQIAELLSVVGVAILAVFI